MPSLVNARRKRTHKAPGMNSSNNTISQNNKKTYQGNNAEWLDTDIETSDDDLRKSKKPKTITSHLHAPAVPAPAAPAAPAVPQSSLRRTGQYY
jgi:hypothetical protein